MKKAFTLSEVLITLAIIGVVSVLTLPNIYKKVNSKIMVETLKNTYSQLVDAVKNKMSDEGVYAWSDLLPDVESEIPNEMQTFMTDYLNVVKVCDSIYDCFSHNYTNLRGESYDLYNIYRSGDLCAFVKLENNAVVAMIPPLPSDDFGDFLVDVNGKAAPNILGIDLFFILFDDDGTVGRLSALYPNAPTLELCAASDTNMCFTHVVHNNWEPLKY